jgi:hypothetical protein
MKGFCNVARALAGVAALVMAAPGLAQGAPPAGAARPDITKPMANVPRATEYAALAKLPDLTGVWYPDWGALFGARGAQPQLTPAAKAKLDASTPNTRNRARRFTPRRIACRPACPGS